MEAKLKELFGEGMRETGTQVSPTVARGFFAGFYRAFLIARVSGIETSVLSIRRRPVSDLNTAV